MEISPISSLLLLLFACCVMWMLLGLDITKLSFRRKIIGTIFLISILAFNTAIILFLGSDTYSKYYLLFSQLPICFLFYFLSEYRNIKLLFVLLTAVFLSSPIIIFSTILLSINMYHVGFVILFYITMLICIYLFFKKPFNYMLKNAENRIIALFNIIPILNYIYAYGLTKYQFGPVSDMSMYLNSRLPTLIVLVSYALTVKVFTFLSEKPEAEQNQMVADTQLHTAIEQIEQLKKVQTQANIYYHDLRHHLSYLNTCMTEQNFKDGTDYIASIYEKIESTTVTCYSENESLNLILSSYVYKATKKNIHYEVEVTATNFTRFSFPDLCSLISNGLENAIIACEQMQKDIEPFISLRIFEKGRSLCIDMKNSYDKEPVFENDLPTSKEQGHGIGVKSMVHIAEKYDGVYQFVAKDGIFKFQVSIETVVDE